MENGHFYLPYTVIIIDSMDKECDLRQRKTNTVCLHSNVELKTTTTQNSYKWRLDWWLPEIGGAGNGEMLVKGYRLPAIR